MVDCSLLKIRDRTLLGSRSFGPRSGGPTRCGNQVAAANYNFLDRPFDSITLRLELALLDGALDKDVVALVEGRGHQGKIPVE